MGKVRSGRMTGASFRALVPNHEFMGATALIRGFCFACWDRVRLTDGHAGPYSECAECGEPTGVDVLVVRRQAKEMGL